MEQLTRVVKLTECMGMKKKTHRLRMLAVGRPGWNSMIKLILIRSAMFYPVSGGPIRPRKGQKEEDPANILEILSRWDQIIIFFFGCIAKATITIYVSSVWT